MGKEYIEISPIKSQYTDPLYGMYTIDKPIASQLNNPEMQKQIERLEGMKSLGLIFHFSPTANHTKWEHYLGMYSVAKRLKNSLTTQEQEQLQLLCLLRGFGHLPCTYLTASAVFLATTLSREFKKTLRTFVSPANKMCNTCEEQIHCIDEPNYSVFESLSYSALRGALSVYKIRRLPREVNIGHRDTLVRSCVCPRDKLYRICNAISRYDYMQRDLHHTGLARFNINYDEAFNALTDGIDALEASPPMRLLDELYDYLVDSLYLRPDIACCESLLAKILAAKLCTGEMDFEAIVEYDDQLLMSKLREVLGESPMTYVRKRPTIYNIRTDLTMNLFEAPNTVGLESRLLGISTKEMGKLQTYPDESGTILSVYHMWDDEAAGTSTFRIILNLLQPSTKIYPFVSIASRLRNRLSTDKPEGDLKLAQQILSYAFGRKRLIYDDSRVRSALLKMVDSIDYSDANEVIWAVCDIFSAYATREDFAPQAKRFWRLLQHPSRRKRHSVRSEEVKRFWELMVRSLMSLASNPNAFSKSWKPIAGILRNLVKDITGDRGEYFEALAYSAELVSTRKGRPKWVLPSVRLLTRGESESQKGIAHENEVDVVSIELLQDDVLIKLIECTESESSTKATADHRKLQRLKEILDSQRFQDLSVSTEVVSMSRVGKDFVSIDQLFSRARS